MSLPPGFVFSRIAWIGFVDGHRQPPLVERRSWLNLHPFSLRTVAFHALRNNQIAVRQSERFYAHDLSGVGFNEFRWHA